MFIILRIFNVLIDGVTIFIYLLCYFNDIIFVTWMFS